MPSFSTGVQCMPSFSTDLQSRGFLLAQASCTSDIRQSISECLSLSRDCVMLKSSFNRPNINYLVRHKELLALADTAASAAYPAAEGGAHDAAVEVHGSEFSLHCLKSDSALF